MAYVPYGYAITDGVVTVDERAADQVRDFFEKYISGLSLAEEVRSKRAKDLGRIAELAAFSAPPPIERFKMRKSEGKLPDDPVGRAEYLYSLIESEV